MQPPAAVGAAGCREMLRDQTTPFGRDIPADGDVENDDLCRNDRAPDDFAFPAAIRTLAQHQVARRLRGSVPTASGQGATAAPATRPSNRRGSRPLPDGALAALPAPQWRRHSS